MKYINVCCVPEPQVLSAMEESFSGDYEKNYYKHKVSDELESYFFGSVSEAQAFLEEANIDEVLRCIYINTTYVLPGSLYGLGDIILPNAFTDKVEQPVFCEYAVSQSYNLETFQIFFHGIVANTPKNSDDDDHYDVYDPFAYEFMKTAVALTSSEKCVALFEFQEGTMVPKHLAAIVDMVMQEG